LTGAPFTEDDFNGWRFDRDAMHFNGGSAFFGYGHRCFDQPRLLVIDKFFKATRSSQRSFMVDGKTPCATLAEALAALALPVTLTEAERALLATVTTDWTIPAGRVALLPLRDMGLVEFEHRALGVQCRLTAAGAALVGGGS
jgi:hypothetical protein